MINNSNLSSDITGTGWDPLEAITGYYTTQFRQGKAETKKKECTIIPETEEVRAMWKKTGEGRERSRTCRRWWHTDENGSARRNGVTRNGIAQRNCIAGKETRQWDKL